MCTTVHTGRSSSPLSKLDLDYLGTRLMNTMTSAHVQCIIYTVHVHYIDVHYIGLLYYSMMPIKIIYALVLMHSCLWLDTIV